MGLVRVRFLVKKGNAWYWQPTKAMRAAGFAAIKLVGTPAQRVERAEAETARWDRFCGKASGEPLPGSVAALRVRYAGRIEDGKEIRRPSFEFRRLRPRTQKDYRYWLDVIEADFGDLPATALTPKVLKVYYQNTVEARGEYAGYHMMTAFRAFLSWCVSEDALDANPGLKVVVSVPAARKVRWTPEQTQAMVAKAREKGRPSIALACLLAEWLAQRPFDVRALTWANYDGKRIVGIRQEKTGTELPPITLTDELRELLDALKNQPVVPTHIIVSERNQQPYSESNFDHLFAAIRGAAGLPKELRFMDFRRTGATEMADSGSGDDQLRSITGHKDRNVVSRYVTPTATTAQAAVDKRLRHRASRGKTLADGQSE